MYNAVSKIFLIAFVAMQVVSCSKSNPDTEAAGRLVSLADTLIATGNYEEALSTLDTLKARYPREIDAQRAGLRMRPLAIQGLTINQIEETDRRQAYLAHVTDSLKNYFTLVHDAALGDDYDYYVVKECKGRNFFERTGVEGRVSPSGEFYIISSLNGRPVKHTSISVTAAGGEATTGTVTYDGELNYRSGGTETITFTGAQTDTIGQFLCNNPSG
ncbi:MAG: tetratricopeptide repeat protein, partial [Muribaculum sp.]|nr:tetratricopeptide repeat protein [Muribaculum sp.]